MPIMEILSHSPEPVAFLSGLASSLVDPAILMLVYERSGTSHGGHNVGPGGPHSACGPNTTASDPDENDAQKRAAQFFMTYNLAACVSSLLPSLAMGQLGDLLSRRLLLVVPLLGALFSKLLLLVIVVAANAPLQWLYCYVTLAGLTGGPATLWAGANAYAARERDGSGGESRRGDGQPDSDPLLDGGGTQGRGYGSAVAAAAASPEREIRRPAGHGRRSRRLMLLELSFGMAATLGSAVSGAVFANFWLPLPLRRGSLSVLAAMFAYATAIAYSLFVLGDARPQAAGRPARVTLKGVIHVYRFGMFKPGGPRDQRAVFTLLFAGAVLYELVVRAFVDFLGLFMLRSPLCFGSELVGYATAVGCCIYVSSFAANAALSRCWTDQALAAMGVASFCAGTLLMSFVKTMPMFFVARALMQLSMMPLPNIRSSMAKITDPQWLGTVFTLLACAMSLERVFGSIAFNYIYKGTLQLPFCLPFLISGVVGLVIFLPLGIVWWKKRQWRVEPSSVQDRS